MRNPPLALTVCEVPVFFATTEGQTARIAERLARVLRDEGLDSRALEVSSPQAARIDWRRVRGVLLGASLHMQRHQHAAATFVDAHVGEMNRVPSAFFSVSLSAASANVEEVRAAGRIARAFPLAHRWMPGIVVSLAGRLAYTQYGFIKRLLLKQIARKEGAPTDTRRDHEFTNWENVDLLARDMAALIRTKREVEAA